MSATTGMAPAPDGRSLLHWESAGEGEPVLLIMGLGLSGGAWWRTVPVLSRRLRVITFDNRGVGRSRAHSYAYTTEAMADDAVAVLDAAGEEAVHVYGVPTLVVHGRHDRMIPVANAELIAERMPAAELRVLEDCGHLYPTEEPSVDEAIVGFLEDAF